MLASIFWIDGRNSRMRWWLTNLGIVISMYIAGGVLLGSSVSTIESLKSGSNAGLGGLIISITLYFGLLILFSWINIICDIRRLHDLNKSGWWSLIYFAPMLGLFFLFRTYGKDIAQAAAPLIMILIAMFLVPIWRLIELGFFSGSAGDNDFGPPSGLGATEDLDEEIRNIARASGRYVEPATARSSIPRVAPAPVVARPAYAAAPTGSASFGKRR